MYVCIEFITLRAPADPTCGFVYSCVRGKPVLSRVNTILDRMAFGQKLISISPKCHLHGTRIQPKFYANQVLSHPRAGS